MSCKLLRQKAPQAHSVFSPARDSKDGSYRAIFLPKFQIVLSLIRHPWWYRVWTLQESALARHCELHCGRASISLEHFLGSLSGRSSISREHFLSSLSGRFHSSTHWAIRYAFQERQERSQYVHSLRLAIADLLYGPNLDGTQLEKTRILRILLFNSFELETKRPSDKVYGLHAVLNRCGLQLEDPDYNKDTASVYESTVLAWIMSHGDLGILTLAARSPTAAPNLPSWVPAWHLGAPDTTEFNRSATSWFGSADTPYHMAHRNPNMSLGAGKLQLRGRWRGVSQYVAPLAVAAKGRSKWQDHMEAWKDASRHLHHSYRPENGTEYQDMLCEMYYALMDDASLEVGLGLHRAQPQVSANLLQPFCDLFDLLIYPERRDTPVWFAALAAQWCSPGPGQYCREEDLGVAVTTKNESDWDDIDDEQLRNRLQKVSCMRLTTSSLHDGTLSVLDDGAIAATPRWSQPGDEVFLFPGAFIPYALRRDGDFHRLVGPAYVYRERDYTKWEFDEAEMVNITLI